jgi:hypothetical protein
MFEDRSYRAKPMNLAERRTCIRKAQADRVAWQIAELLGRREFAKAATLLPAAIALIGPQALAFWVRHYATTKFGVARSLVANFIEGALPEGVAA